MKKWNDLSLTEKAEMMKVAILNGITSLSEIKEKYNEFAEGGEIEEIVEKVNSSKAPFVQRLKDPNRNYIQDWTDNRYIATHKLSVGTDRQGNSYIYPEVQEIDGKLIDFTRPPYAPWSGMISAEERGDTVRVPSIEQGVRFTENYKKYYPKGNTFASGGSIHIDPSKKGTFTAAASKHGKSVQEFASQVLAHPENYSPAMRKKANFARNAKHWKHGLGGNLFDDITEDSQQMNVLSTGNANLYGFGDWLKKSITRAREVVHSFGLDKSPSQHILERIFSDDRKNNTEEKELSNIRDAPVRQRPNASKTTPKESTLLENMMRDYLINKDKTVGTSNPEYDIPFIPEKAVLINGSTTSTNALDSLAKYAGIHNRNVQLSQYPLHKREYYTKRKLLRPVTMNEMLGLSTRETDNGAMPAYNYAQNNEDKRKVLNIDYKRYNNALGNANYFTAFGSIPAEYLVRNFHYDNKGVDRSTPPLLDAFRYYAQGDYNSGEPGHTANVEAYGEEAWRNPYVRKWWEESGQYWYNGTKK